MKQNNMLLTVGVAIVIGAIAFFGGMKFQQMKSPLSGADRMVSANGGRTMAIGNGERRIGGARPAQGMGMTMGEVTSVDDASVTMKLQDGSSKIINLKSSTTYTKAAEGTKADVKTGERIAVFGTAGSDGSITAESVQLNPMMRMIQRGTTGQSDGKPTN